MYTEMYIKCDIEKCTPRCTLRVTTFYGIHFTPYMGKLHIP